MLKRNGDRERPCFVSDLHGKASGFSLLSMMSAVGFFVVVFFFFVFVFNQSSAVLLVY